MKLKSEMHELKLKEVLEQNQRMEEEKKQQFYARQHEAETRKKKIE